MLSCILIFPKVPPNPLPPPILDHIPYTAPTYFTPQNITLIFRRAHCALYNYHSKRIL